MADSRPAAEIFNEIRSLCHEPGFLHAISFIKSRDFFVSVDLQGAMKYDHERRYSRSELNHNELMLLVGLLAQSDSPNVFEEVADTVSLVACADRLLEELHVALEAPMREMLQERRTTEHFGLVAREAIYYGADSAFFSQYKMFARDRYRNDFAWLLANKGLSIRPIIDIAHYIIDGVNMQLTYVFHHYSNDPNRPAPPHISSALLIDKKLLIKRFGRKMSNFIHAFAIPVNNSNLAFTDPFAFNEASARPLLDLGSHVYVANQYKLFESIYESPYYWMLSDDNYKNAAADNRGKFLERAIATVMQLIFGAENVFSNVIIKTDKSRIAAEADILVVYGEFMLVVQAKSKRLTLEARAGDAERINTDFQHAVQAAYDQAITFVDLVVAGAECEMRRGDRRTFKQPVRVFPLVVLSDHFPSLTILTNQLIKKIKDQPPVVIDLFFLETMGELLRTPLGVLYYLQQRSRFFDRIMTDSELNLLGFHMGRKLYVPEEYHMMMIDRDFARDIDEYVTSKEVGRPPAVEFLAMEERCGVPAATPLIASLKSGPPEATGAAIELLDLSGEALEGVAESIEEVRAEVRAGKVFKSFSVETHYGGISYAAVSRVDRETVSMAEAVAQRHKYNARKDRWYLLLDDVSSGNVLDGVAPILTEWVESKEMADFVQAVEGFMKSTFIPFKGTRPIADEGSPG